MRINEILVESAELEEGWKSTLGAAALGVAGALGGYHALNKSSEPTPEPVAKTQQVQQTPKVERKKEFSPLSQNPELETYLAKTAAKSGIRGTELAQFLAQVGHESWNFERLKEKPQGKNYFQKKYDIKFNPRIARALGNLKAGDGERYHGRGFIQLTGKDNYERTGKALGLDLVNHPELAANPEVAAKIAIHYWNTRVKPHVSDWEDTESVTKRINSRLKGLPDRQNLFDKYQEIL